ncbi:MAG: calcium-binding protein [Patulibacter minatonensis]
MSRDHLSLGAAGRPRVRAALCVLLASTAVAATPAVSSGAVIVGTPGGDTLVGTDPNGDLLFGGGGADTLTGGAGNDVIYGVRSGNTLNGGEGNNYIEGGAGDDKVTAGNGNNTVYGGSGHDSIALGDGNNYVDPGGAPDVVTLGNGNNVVNGGSGGMDLTGGNGNNLVYAAGLDSVTLGGGVNTVYVANVYNLKSVNCGGNPASKVLAGRKGDENGTGLRKAVASGKITGCPIVEQFDKEETSKATLAGTWDSFDLVGTEGPDRLFGGHGGGKIDGKGGNNILWADYLQDTGGARAQALTTSIRAGDGNNTVFGGRGTNLIELGNGKNFVRAGAWNNTITVGRGYNAIRLQGKGKNTVTIKGGTGYVEAFANGQKPSIRCEGGAKVSVVYGNTKPKTNCSPVVNARTSKGKILQVQGVEHIADSEPLVLPAPVPGELAGVPRPN